MKADDKEVDSAELLRATRKEDELDKGDDEELPELAGEQVRDTKHDDRGMLLGTMRAILDGQTIIVNDLRLPKRQLLALEALKAAVDGKDQEIDHFMYASDRSDLLEQALAILQPSLTQGDAKDIQGVMHEMIGRVSELRQDLKGLEDAQDELLDGQHKAELGKAEGDTDDKPKPQPDGDASLTGPEREEVSKVTSLLGPEIKQTPKPATTLVGPDRKADVKPPSTLAGPDVTENKLPSTLGGPDLKPEAEQPSSLGDPAELEVQNKKPWWKRPFG